MSEPAPMRIVMCLLVRIESLSSVCHLCKDIAALWSTSRPLSAVTYCGLIVFPSASTQAFIIVAALYAFICHCVGVVIHVEIG
eukprot:5612864-Amphidinium_carterae.2